jgi:hypothetical protein
MDIALCQSKVKQGTEPHKKEAKLPAGSLAS